MKRLAHNLIMLIFTLCGLYTQCRTQDVGDRSVKEYFRQNDHYGAAVYLTSQSASRPKDHRVWYDLGNAHHHSRNHTAAIPAYERLMKLIGKKKGLRNKYYKAFYFYASSMMAEGKYEHARKMFLEFIRLRPKTMDFRSLKKMANKRLKACDLRMKASDKTILNEYAITPVNINSGYSDFGPVWLDQDKLLFTSLRSDTVLSRGNAFHFPNKLYITEKQNGWSEPTEFEDFSHSIYHTANGSFSADGNKFAFTYCQENKHQEIRCAIYMSQKKDGVWLQTQETKKRDQ